MVFFIMEFNIFYNSGGARKFVTDRIEAMYGLRWNSVFTCSDLTADEAVNNHHSLYYQTMSSIFLLI